MGTYIAEELFKRGVKVWDDDGRPGSPVKSAHDELVSSGHQASPSPTNAICWASVPSHAHGHFDGQYRAMLTMWESMRLPENFRDKFDNFDLIMVPSLQNLELFSRYHPNVRFVPLGIDPKVWNYSPPPEVGPTFNFLISGRGKRKGCDIAYEAFQTVFGHWWQYNDDTSTPVYVGPPDKPIPQLIMKSLKGHGDYYAPGVKHVTGKLSDEDEVTLYRSVHCYLQPSRGEGFGLQPLQAIAVGRPTILTNAHGHESYAHLGIGIDATATEAEYFIMGDAGDWWEPDFEQVCEAMWDVYAHYDTHVERARDSAIEVAQHWTWKNTANAFVDAFDGALTKPYTGNGEWVQMEQKLFPCKTIRRHHMEAAGIMYQFDPVDHPEREYWVPADVKRVLFDAGLLDPAYIDDDESGLAPQQIEQLDKYRADKSHCWACSQELNTRPTLADKYFRMDELERENAELRAELEQVRRLRPVSLAAAREEFVSQG